MNKLLAWRRERGLNRAELSRLWGVPAETIRRWEMGLRVPEPERMSAIYAETAGQVAPGDFYDLRPLGAPAEDGEAA
jgi:transcriptional regulator with XRE-family HTH domain